MRCAEMFGLYSLPIFFLIVYRFSLQAAERRVPLVWLLQGGARPSAIFTFFTGSRVLFESSPDLWMFEVQGGSYLEPTRGDRAISSSFWRHASHLDWKKTVRDSWLVTRNWVFAWRPHTRNAVWEGTHHWEDVLLVCWTLQHYQAQTKQRKADMPTDFSKYDLEISGILKIACIYVKWKNTSCIAVRAFLAATVPWSLSDFLPFESPCPQNVGFMRHTLEHWWPRMLAQSQKAQFIGRYRNIFCLLIWVSMKLPKTSVRCEVDGSLMDVLCKTSIKIHHIFEALMRQEKYDQLSTDLRKMLNVPLAWKIGRLWSLLSFWNLPILSWKWVTNGGIMDEHGWKGMNFVGNQFTL